MTRHRRFLIALAVCALTAAGCSSIAPGEERGTATAGPHKTTRLTLSEAKQRTLHVEGAVAESIPPGKTLSSTRLDKAHLLACDSDRAFQWPGRTIVTLRGEPDVAKILDDVARRWSTTTGFTVARRSAPNGYRDVVIRAADGGQFFVEARPADAAIVIASFSPCFVLSGGDDGLAH